MALGGGGEGKPDSVSSLAAEGKKLSLWRAVVAFSNRILLPEGSRVRRPWPGWEGSAMIFLALLSALESCRDLREGRGRPITLSAERITRCSLTRSFAAAAGNQVMMEWVRMDSMMAV